MVLFVVKSRFSEFPPLANLVHPVHPCARGVGWSVSEASETQSDQTLPVKLAQDTPPNISVGHSHLWVGLQRPATALHHGTGQTMSIRAHAPVATVYFNSPCLSALMAIALDTGMLSSRSFFYVKLSCMEKTRHQVVWVYLVRLSSSAALNFINCFF